ncbi:MAG: hypothetical protein ACK5GN_02220 [Pseudomonadota bacterium]|jgi:hypothetical protein
MNNEFTPKFSDPFSDALQICVDTEESYRLKASKIERSLILGWLLDSQAKSYRKQQKEYGNLLPKVLLADLDERNRIAARFSLQEGERVLAFFRDSRFLNSRKGIVLTSDAIITGKERIPRLAVSSVSVSQRGRAAEIHVSLDEKKGIDLRLRRWGAYASIIGSIFTCWKTGTLSDDVRHFQQLRIANVGIRKDKDTESERSGISRALGVVIPMLGLYYIAQGAYKRHLRTEAQELLNKNGFKNLTVDTVGLPLDALFVSKTEVSLVIMSGPRIAAAINMNVIGHPIWGGVIEISGDQMLKLEMSD